MAGHSYSDKFIYHEPGLQHQFDDMGQQEESVSIGMWMFLVQEIMFFGGLFTVYLVFRSKYPMAFAAGSNHLDVVMGFVNTLVLIVSSLTMALTVYYAQKGKRNMQVILILLTMGFGLTFLGVKAIEYTDKYNHGLIPVSGWNKVVRQEAKAGGEAAEKPCWEHGHGEEHEYVNPHGDFMWADCSLAKMAQDNNFLTTSEKNQYLVRNEKGDLQVDADKLRDQERIFFWIYFINTGLPCSGYSVGSWPVSLLHHPVVIEA